MKGFKRDDMAVMYIESKDNELKDREARVKRLRRILKLKLNRINHGTNE